MMTFEKELTPDQISGMEELGRLKQKLPADKWVLFRALMLAYLGGVEAGISLEGTQEKTAV